MAVIEAHTLAHTAPIWFEESAIFARETPGHFDLAAAGILYVDDFDAPEVPPDEPAIIAPAIVEPVYGEQDLHDACERAREEGRLAGLEQACEETHIVQAQLRLVALTSIGDALTAGAGERAAAAERLGQHLCDAVLALLMAALPATSKALAGHEMAALLGAVLPPLKREPAVHISVHPDLVDDMSAFLRGASLPADQSCTLHGDAAREHGDVLVRWSDGEIMRDTGALWSDLQRILAPYALPRLADIRDRECGIERPLP
jgi:hypothetical protein